MRIEFSLIHLVASPPPPSSHLRRTVTTVCLSHPVSLVFRKGHIGCICAVVSRSEKNRSPPPPPPNPPNASTFETITCRGIHLSWFGFVSEVTHKRGAPFVAQN